MDRSKQHSIHKSVRFFELLLDQFRGPEGELYSATQYLLNSSTEQNYSRRSSLIRIAREKIENAESLASILLALAQCKSPPLHPSRREEALHDLLTKKSIDTKCYDIAKAYAEKINFMDAIDGPPTAFSSDPPQYLKKYIKLEERQIATYETLCTLTDNQSFLGVLAIARNRQFEHKEAFVKLLNSAAGEVATA